MNELKPEDVMRALEHCGYSTSCKNCLLEEYGGKPCILKYAHALLKKYQAENAEKDAEIERLKKYTKGDIK